MPNIPWTRVSTYNNFTPTAFTGCTLWLDAADSSSISTTSGNVTQWRDKSGNANHTTAGTGQPTYTSPFVVFGGSAQLILPLVFSTDWSIFVVAKTTQTTGTSGQQWWAGAGLFDAEVSSPVNDYGMSLVGGFLATGVGSSDTTIQSASAVNTGNLFIAEFLRTSSSGLMSNIVTGGTAVTTTGPTGARTGVTRISLGALQTNLGYFIGSIAEVVAFNSVISDTQRQNVEGYLAWKWGFVSSLPANHPGARINIPIFTIPFLTLFSPRSIASCALWLDGLDPAGTGTAPSAGSTVSTWTDKSTSAKNATAGGTPTYVSGGGINFNGTSWFSNVSFVQNLSQRSIFIIMQETTHAGTRGVFPLIPDPSSGLDYTTTNGLTIETSNGLRFYGFSGAYQSDIGNASLLVKAIYNDNMNVRAGSGFLNGNAATTVTATYTAGTCSGYGVGSRWNGASGISASGALNGVIFEIMYFNSPLGLSDRRNIEGYLAQKWGLTASLPVGHPGLTQTFYSTTPPAGSLGGVTSTIVITNKPPLTVVSGMLLNLDAVSYTSGSTWTALVGNNYTITGTLTTASSAVVFDGTAYAQDLTGILSSTMYSYTLDVWFYAAANATGSIIGELGQVGLGGWELTLISISTNTISVGFWTGAVYKLSLGSYTANTWTHVSYSYNASTSAVIGYVNGVSVSTGTATKQWPTTVYITTGGKTHPNTIFTGRIGAFKVYNSVLSAADIRQNYNALAGRYGLGLI